MLPRRATLLNTGQEVEARVEMLPGQFKDKTELLRLRGLPVNEMPGTVLVVRLEFDQLPETPEPPKPKGAEEP